MPAHALALQQNRGDRKQQDDDGGGDDENESFTGQSI